jgi:hypothetical protein
MSWYNKNLLTRLFRRPTHTTARRAQTNRFRPALLPLEDRTVPAGADLFANATLLTGSFATDTGSNVGTDATGGETGEPVIPNATGNPANSLPINSVWWKWTATSSGTVEVNTYGSDFDTLLGVYTGSAVDALTPVATNDDAESIQSQLFFNAVAGTTYYIDVDGFGGDVGNVRLHLGMAPANDDFADAVAVTGGTVTGHNLLTTGEPGEPGGVVSGEANTAWWTWRATTSGSAEVNTFGSTFDTRLAVYRDTTPGTPASSFSELFQLVVSDDATDPNSDSTLQSQALFTATAGETYYIVVDGFLNETGKIVLTVPAAPTSNNHAPEIADQELSVDENSSGGAVVGLVDASDEDAGQSLTYSILGGNGASLFSINPTTGVIQVLNSNTLNYEAQSSYQLTVQVTDNGNPNLSDSATVTIKLNDINETPVLNNTAFGVVENSANGTVVGTVTGTDVDAGHTLTYSIVGGNTGGAFAINPTTGQITVVNAAAVDFETNPTFNLTVRVTDNGSLFDDATVTVNLSDADDNSPAFLIGQLSNQITGLVTDGSLTTSQAADLQAKLDVIKKKLADGSTNVALNNLKAFMNQVKNLVSTGALTTAEGDSLINAACALKVALGG